MCSWLQLRAALRAERPSEPGAHAPKRPPAAKGRRGKVGAVVILAGACLHCLPKAAAVQWPTHRHLAAGHRCGLHTLFLTLLPACLPWYRPGHSTVHRLAPNAVLAERFNTVECLRAQPELAKFAAFASRQRDTIGRTR